MDIIKPLAGEWGLMTPSGPILGLNKRRKIKLRSKLQPACSRAVYQQCAKNRGQKKEGWVVFPLFICCCFVFSAYLSFLFYDRGGFFFYLWETWRALLVLGCKKGSNCRIPNKSNDWNWNMQGRDLLSLSGYGLSAFTSAVPYIQAQRLVVWIRPAIIHSVWASESDSDCDTSATASNHGHNGTTFTPSSCYF